jgi:hypothetical protein
VSTKLSDKFANRERLSVAFVKRNPMNMQLFEVSSFRPGDSIPVNFLGDQLNRSDRPSQIPTMCFSTNYQTKPLKVRPILRWPDQQTKWRIAARQPQKDGKLQAATTAIG